MSRSGEKKEQFNHANNSDSVEVLSYAEQVEECFMELYMQYDIPNVPERRKPKAIDSIWNEIYKQVFKPDRPQYNNCQSKLAPWQVEQLEAVVNVYIDLCNRYGGVIKYNQFCKLVGYSRYTIDYWHKLNIDNRYIFIINSDDLYKEYESSVYIIKDSETVDNIIQLRDNIYIDDIKANSGQERDILSRRRLDVKKKLNAEMQDENTNALSVDTMGAAIRANNEEELGKLYEPKRMIQHEQIKQALSVSDLPKLSDNTTQFTPKLPPLIVPNQDTIQE